MSINPNNSGRTRRTIVHQTSSGSRGIRRTAASGFTLLEMLVSVALVLLMMTIFAQIFQMATGALSQQRGIAENDQKARMLTTIFRGDLDHRTFRDVFPFRSGEDTRQLGHSLSRRSGYFEIDEGDPLSDIDDVLQFTALVNIQSQNKDSTPFTGKAGNLGGSAPIVSVISNSSFKVSGDVTTSIFPNSFIWIAGSTKNDGRYAVNSVSFSGGVSTISVNAAYLPLNNLSPSAFGKIYRETNEPDFDDGVIGNGTSVSSAAEVCYFLRNGVLYRRVLLIREPAAGGNAQPTYSNGTPQLWNQATGGEFYGAPGATTFWRDFDYSAFYFSGKNGSLAPGVRFHSATESLSNSSHAPQLLLIDSVTPATSFPISLGIPNLRFGHSTNGLTQDASTSAALPGPDGVYGSADDLAVSLNRFTLQECSNSAFGYPGYLPSDPVSGAPNTNPFNRSTIRVDPNMGLVVEYSNQAWRRGEDILMSNVLTFDVKVWDEITGGFVDVGDSTLPQISPFNPANSTNVIYGGTNGHYRFDTWHPLASTGNGNPPFVPRNQLGNPSSLMAIQITINYRDISSGQVRQTTIVQSLVDRAKLQAVTNEAPEE